MYAYSGISEAHEIWGVTSRFLPCGRIDCFWQGFYGEGLRRRVGNRFGIGSFFVIYHVAVEICLVSGVALLVEEEMDQAALQVQPGSDGLLCLYIAVAVAAAAAARRRASNMGTAWMQCNAAQRMDVILPEIRNGLVAYGGGWTL